MKLNEVLALDAVFADMEASCDKQALLKVAGYAASHSKTSAQEIFEALTERERLGSTACGGGVAIPHARLPGLKQMICEFVRLKKGVHYNAPDGKPVDMMFVIFAPAEGGGEHLRALSHIARMLRDAEFCDSLRRAPSRETIYRLLIDHG